MGRTIERHSRHRTLGPPLLALLLLAAVSAPARAAFPATVDVNDTAFDPPCRGGLENSYPEKMLPAAVTAYARLGYTTTGFTGKVFTKSHVLARTPSDWGYYAHSHGDRYLLPDGTRDYGFRSDAGLCSGAPVIAAKDIAAKRKGRQSNLVVMSMCFLGDAPTSMPAAFAIQKSKAVDLAWNGPEFYVGYHGEAWDSDEWLFEQRFWDALGDGRGVGAAFDVALARGGWGHPFGADWWGSYYWSGRAGPGSSCTNCV